MYDLFVIGGGINGAGIARDAAGRGLTVGLAERDDLGSHTSSASTKLIHGGLRYLENYEFRLVREALMEREVLLRAAPHIIWPLRFVLPHHKGLRPAWMLRAGLFLYDILGSRTILPPTRRVNLLEPPYRDQLHDTFRQGFEYSDCWVEDSRLVVLNAMDARERGADIFTRTSCTGLARESDHWRITLTGAHSGTVTARALVNAAGPWVDHIDRQVHPGRNASTVRLIKGSHIVLPKLYEGEHAFIFQNTDKRIVFAIPYERAFTLVGTTDVAVASPEDGAHISEDEIGYICEAVSAYLKQPVRREDVIWSYAGVRPLFDDASDNASKITRDYTLTLDADGPPTLSVYGGKITTYRMLAEHALEKLEPVMGGFGAPWTQGAALPGGDIANADFESCVSSLTARRPLLPAALLRRLIRAYGTRTPDLLGEAETIADLGAHFGAGLHECELHYLIDREFVREADDVLWRRSKLGLHMSAEERRAVADWFASRT